MLLFWGQIYNKYISVCVWVRLGLRRDQSLDSNSENRVLQSLSEMKELCVTRWCSVQLLVRVTLNEGHLRLMSILTLNREQMCKRHCGMFIFSIIADIRQNQIWRKTQYVAFVCSGILYFVVFSRCYPMYSLLMLTFWGSSCERMRLVSIKPVNVLLFRCFDVVGGNNLFSGIYKWKVCFSPSIVCS